jgi:hypothetical protein
MSQNGKTHSTETPTISVMASFSLQMANCYSVAMTDLTHFSKMRIGQMGMTFTDKICSLNFAITLYVENSVQYKISLGTKDS